MTHIRWRPQPVETDSKMRVVTTDEIHIVTDDGQEIDISKIVSSVTTRSQAGSVATLTLETPAWELELA